MIIDNDSGSIPDYFIPFGFAHGDSTVPRTDDGSSEVIVLNTDIVLFGSNHRRLYVSCRTSILSACSSISLVLRLPDLFFTLDFACNLEKLRDWERAWG